MPFAKLGLSTPILKAVAELGYTQPTSIQKQAIPAILLDRNLLAASQTGTGKTASFVLPLLEKLYRNRRYGGQTKVRGKRVRILVLTPTRELATQVEESIAEYGKHLDFTSMALYGGVDEEPQKERLIEGVDFLVATPGRLVDMVHQRALHFDEVETLVLDEADRMLDMGFIDDIYNIIDRLPDDRQNLLFSATLNDHVRNLSTTFSGVGMENKEFYDDLLEINISPKETSASSIDQWLITVDKDTKSALLSHLIKEQEWDQALIFIEKKHGAAKLVSQLEKRGIKADCIHGDRSQSMREKVLASFKSGELKYLVATGVAARGIDIGDLSRVVNYDLPFKPEEYIHRIGRTGRAGAEGEAISFVAMGDFKNLCAIESRLGHIVKRKEIDGFPVRKAVPVSILNYVRKANRPDAEGKQAPSKDTPPKRTKGNKPATEKASKKRAPRHK